MKFSCNLGIEREVVIWRNGYTVWGGGAIEKAYEQREKKMS